MEEIADVYARALFEVAKENDVLDRVHDELGEFADALDEDRNLQVFLFSPYFSSEEKKDGAREQLAADAAVADDDLAQEDLKDDLRSIRGYGEDR